MKFLLTFALVAFLCGCSTDSSQPEEPGIVEYASGVTKETVEGVDFWRYGKPPMNYKSIGFINDERGSGWIPMASMLDDVAYKVKERGGDAAIIVSDNFKMTGMYIPKNGGIGTPLGRNFTRFQVIRYL